MKLAAALKKTLVAPGKPIRLDTHDPAATNGFHKRGAEARLEVLGRQLRELQTVLAAAHDQKVLIVLQGMDTSGKDGTISHVFQHVNPQGVKVARFNVPTADEIAHDFLWRVHAQVPAAGEMVIFNRSHYEDVLAPRVHATVPPSVWKKRYRRINDFEALLIDTGTTILKFFLHISKEEQKRRLTARLEDPAKIWKFERGDLRERKFWSEYRVAYEELLRKTSTKQSPWRIIPADRKWHRNLLVAGALVETMQKMNLRYPKPAPGLEKVRIE
jgi:PPK2 family polyphosphate:nucleotide phosphotransferase